MKILYIAFACDPHKGSEAQCGWAWPMYMREYADVCVLTRSENKPSIESYLKEKNIKNISVVYYDIPNWMNVYYKYGKLYHAYYILWQHLAYRRIKKLHEQGPFDVIHQVTLGDFRVINHAWKLNTNFLLGPVGGAQLTPKSLEVYSKNDRKGEAIRKFINRITVWRPGYKRALNNAKYVFAANPETLEYLSKQLKDPRKCRLLSENGITQEKLRGIPNRREKEKVSIMWAGRMVYRKGLTFLLDVLAETNPNNEYEVWLVGDGPEKENLEKLAKEKGLSKRIVFLGKVDYDRMKEIYTESDIFVFPSIRETTGTVLFEAMSYALPIVTFNQNGAALLLDDDSGVKVDIEQDLFGIKRDFALALEKLIDNPILRSEMGKAGYHRIKKSYIWSDKCRDFYRNFLEELSD